jgi:hypothetical protein
MISLTATIAIICSDTEAMSPAAPFRVQYRSRILGLTLIRTTARASSNWLRACATKSYTLIVMKYNRCEM